MKNLAIKLLLSHSQSLYEWRTSNDINLFYCCDNNTIELFSEDLRAKSVKFKFTFFSLFKFYPFYVISILVLTNKNCCLQHFSIFIIF